MMLESYDSGEINVINKQQDTTVGMLLAAEQEDIQDVINIHSAELQDL